jgi:hypothetical protein
MIKEVANINQQHHLNLAEEDNNTLDNRNIIAEGDNRTEKRSKSSVCQLQIDDPDNSTVLRSPPPSTRNARRRQSRQPFNKDGTEEMTPLRGLIIPIPPLQIPSINNSGTSIADSFYSPMPTQEPSAVRQRDCIDNWPSEFKHEAVLRLGIRLIAFISSDEKDMALTFCLKQAKHRSVFFQAEQLVCQSELL